MSEKYYSTGELVKIIKNGMLFVEGSKAIIARLRAGDKLCEVIMKEINSQAEDEALWFVTVSAPEAYLQRELRKLHRVSEKAIAEYEGKKEKK